MNQIVKIENKDLLPFFFPNRKVFRVPSDESVKGLDILYIGDYYKDLFSFLNSAKSYITTVGHPTIDLSSRDKIIEWIKDKFSISINDDTKSYLLSLEEKSFISTVKLLSTGKFKVKISKDELTIWNLMYDSCHKSTLDFLKTYLILSDKYPKLFIEQSFITYYIKALKFKDSDNYSLKYKALLKQFNHLINTNNKSLKSYLNRSDNLAFLDLLISIREV